MAHFSCAHWIVCIEWFAALLNDPPPIFETHCALTLCTCVGLRTAGRAVRGVGWLQALTWPVAPAAKH